MNVITRSVLFIVIIFVSAYFVTKWLIVSLFDFLIYILSVAICMVVSVYILYIFYHVFLTFSRVA